MNVPLGALAVRETEVTVDWGYIVLLEHLHGWGRSLVPS